MTAAHWGLVTCCLWSLGTSNHVYAQAPPVTVVGRVVRVTARGPQPVAAARVTLHRIGSASAGPVDSVVTDGGGRYRFRVMQPDSTAIYLPTTRHGGIAYFASPARGGARGVGEIEVFDTTSAPVRLHTAGRHLVVSAPNADGEREVVDVYEVQNDSVVTRLGTRDRPAFVARLPRGAREVRATRGDFTGEAVALVPGGAGIVAPIPPGVRQLALTYQVSADALPFTLTLDDTTAVVEVLLEESGARVVGAGLAALGAVSSEGRTFVRYLGRDIPAGQHFEVQVGAGPGASRAVEWGGLLGLGAASLGAVGWTLRAGRNSGPGAQRPSGAPSPTQRARELRAAIDGVDLMLAHGQAAEASRASLARYRDQMEAELNLLLAAPLHSA